MRSVAIILLMSLANCLYGQAVVDSIHIKTVEIKGKKTVVPSVQRLDSSALHDSQYQNLGESLQENANLYVKSQGVGSMATVSMRGTNATQTQLYWNGIKLNSAANGVVDLSLFPTSFIDNAKIQYGISSLSNGSGGLGGAIEMDNSPRFSEHRKLHFQQKIGSFGFYNSNLRVDLGNDKFKSISRLFYRQAKNDFTYKNFNKIDQPTERLKNASLEQKGLMQSFYYRPKTDQMISLHFWGYDSDRQLPPLMANRMYEENQIDKSLRLLLQYDKYYKKLKFTATTAVLRNSIFYYNERASTKTLSNNNDWQSRLKWEIDWNKKLKALVKIHLDYSEIQADEGGNKINQKQSGIFAQVNYYFHPKWQLSTTLREKIVLDETAFLLGALKLEFTPFKDFKNLSFYANSGKNMKYPNLNDLYWQPGGNPDLKAEESWTTEVGLHIQGDFQGYSTAFNLAAYQSSIENYIQWQPTMYGYWEANNLKEVAVKGIELRLSIADKKSILKKKISANYTFTQSLNKKGQQKEDASVDKQLVYLPVHQFNAATALEWKKIFLKYNFQLMGARYTTSDNSDYLPYYQLSSFTLGRKVVLGEHQFQFSMVVRNIFDVEYQAILYRPMPARNYQFTLNYYW